MRELQMGQAAKTGRSALPPSDLHPATCSPIESLGRHRQSSRIHDAQALRCKRLTRQMCGVALRRAARTDCGRSAARPQRGQGDGRQGRAPARCGFTEGTPCVADRANSPRGPQRRHRYAGGPATALDFPGQFSVISGRPRSASGPPVPSRGGWGQERAASGRMSDLRGNARILRRSATRHRYAARRVASPCLSRPIVCTFGPRGQARPEIASGGRTTRAGQSVRATQSRAAERGGTQS
jgi:hypothetical protein